MLAEEVSIDGRRVRLWGGGEGPPLVLLHGAQGDAERCWASIWDRLAQHYSVIAPDLPGCGGSQALRRSALPELVAWLDGVIEAMDFPAVRLAGCDAGATLARAYAAEHPDRCVGLVLINGGALPESPGRLLTRLGLGPPQKQPTTPTLVFWSQDAHAAPFAAEQVTAQLPRAAFRLIPGLGALPQVEAPDETADILLAFLG
jgi:pimeloyl-ACP methyl ester carboxylesterase